MYGMGTTELILVVIVFFLFYRIYRFFNPKTTVPVKKHSDSSKKDSSKKIPFRISEHKVGKWFISYGVDNFFYPPLIMAILPSDSGRSFLGRPIGLGISLNFENRLSLHIYLYTDLGSEKHIPVLTRIGSNEPELKDWKVDKWKKQNAIYPNSTNSYLKEMMKSNIYVAEVKPRNGDTITAVFDTTDMKEALKYIMPFIIPENVSRLMIDKVGRWTTESVTDPVNDLKWLVSCLYADYRESSPQARIVIVYNLNCMRISMQIEWFSNLGSEEHISVLTRIGSNEPELQNWQLSAEGKITFYPHSSSSYIGRMEESNKFVAEVTPTNGETPITAVFDTTGMEEALKHIEKYYIEEFSKYYTEKYGVVI